MTFFNLSRGFRHNTPGSEACSFLFSNRHHEPRKISILVLYYPYLILTSFGQSTACGGILYCTQFCGDLPFVFSSSSPRLWVETDC